MGEKSKAKKRPRASSSSSRFNRGKFVSAEAEQRYNEGIVKRSCIPERGFSNFMDDWIARLHWEQLCKHPNAAVIPVVREFYANAPEHDHHKVFVRGKWVLFDCTTINEYYGLPNIDNNDFTRYKEGTVNHDKIIQRLAPGAHWKSTATDVTNFPSKHMTYETRAWHYFICGKLLPTNNFSQVTKERAILNYAIHKGMTIDVGALIQQNVRHNLQGTTTAGYGYPSLIYELCLRHGVLASSTEEVIHPKAALTCIKVSRFQGGVAEGSSTAALAGPDIQETHAPSRQYSAHAHLHHIEQTTHSMFAYQLQAMQFMHHHRHDASAEAPFPQPPDFSMYSPPPSPPQNDDE